MKKLLIILLLVVMPNLAKAGDLNNFLNQANTLLNQTNQLIDATNTLNKNAPPPPPQQQPQPQQQPATAPMPAPAPAGNNTPWINPPQTPVDLAQQPIPTPQVTADSPTTTTAPSSKGVNAVLAAISPGNNWDNLGTKCRANFLDFMSDKALEDYNNPNFQKSPYNTYCHCLATKTGRLLTKHSSTQTPRDAIQYAMDSCAEKIGSIQATNPHQASKPAVTLPAAAPVTAPSASDSGSNANPAYTSCVQNHNTSTYHDCSCIGSKYDEAAQKLGNAERENKIKWLQIDIDRKMGNADKLRQQIAELKATPAAPSTDHEGITRTIMKEHPCKNYEGTKAATKDVCMKGNNTNIPDAGARDAFCECLATAGANHWMSTNAPLNSAMIVQIGAGGLNHQCKQP